jgi:DeoR/GlpR family transcriptional regulator of sugar metabolism
VAEASTSRAFMASASTTVVVADSSKWSLRALAQIAPIGAADRILMDSDLPSSAAKTLGGLTELTLVETK